MTFFVRSSSRPFLPLLLMILATSAMAQSSDEKFDRFLEPYVAEGDFSGGVLVARGNKILFERFFGKSNYELNTPNTPDSKFHIASVTKTFTAAAILLLQEQGKLHLTDTVAMYIPDFTNGKKITIKELLEHSSGLPDYYSFPEYKDLARRRVTLSDLIAIVGAKPLDFEPGTKSSYSNTGYAFLAFIIEKVSGVSYGAFVDEHILRSAGMNESGTWNDEDLIPFRASGYQPWVGSSRLRNAPSYDKTILTGSGSLYSTVDDLYKWCKAVRGNRIFNLSAQEYPYGWGARELDGRKFIEQNGRDPGFVSHISLFLNDDLVIILLSNVEVAADDAISKGLAKIAFGENPEPAESRFSFQLASERADKYVGRYEIAPNLMVDVGLKNGRLFLRGPGGDYLPLEPTGEDEFFYRQLYVTVVFAREKDGSVSALLWNGQYPCKKISNAPLP